MAVFNYTRTDLNQYDLCILSEFRGNLIKILVYGTSSYSNEPLVDSAHAHTIPDLPPSTEITLPFIIRPPPTNINIYSRCAQIVL